MTDEPRPRIEVTVAAPVEAAWAALRDKEKLRHWHGWEFDGLEAELDAIYFTAVTEDADSRTLQVDGGDVFRLDPVDGGTRITLTRAPHGDDPDWDAYYDDITEGWVAFLQQLRFALERHPGDPRRTLYYSGRGDLSGSPADELGLTDQPVGSTYELNLPGEEATGTVWFRSSQQVGLTVEGWGDGLLIVSHVGRSDQKPRGAAMAVLTLYGADDAALAAVDRRWQPWWSERYPSEEPAPTEL